MTADSEQGRIERLESRVAALERLNSELEVRHHLFDGVLSRMPVVLFQLDAEGVFTESLGAGLARLGLAERQAVGLNALDAFPAARADLERSLAGESAVFETRGETPDGEPWCFVTYAEFDHGQGSGLIAFSIDITERVLAERRASAREAQIQSQLQQSQKLESLGLLAGGIAHDFNNLLVGVLGNASLALMETPEGRSGYQELRGIEDAAQRAAELCQQLLAYSGKGRFMVRPVDLGELVPSTARLLEVSIPKGVHIQFDVAPDLPAVDADVTQLRQVIMNLVVNAAESMGEEGRVTIAVGSMSCDESYLAGATVDEQLPLGRYAFIEVSDTGAGMDQDTQRQMFDPFFSTKMTGRGLGMAAVLGIVRGHGGGIKVYSEVGRGTTIKVLFPASDDAARPVEDLPSPDGVWRGSGQVLIVDDEEMVRAFARRVLQRAGFEIVTAVDGPDALNKYREHEQSIRLILLDLTMPGMSGEAVFRELRRIRSDARIILSSGYNEQDTTSRFAGKGLAAFVQKPYAAAALLAVVRSVLDETDAE